MRFSSEMRQKLFDFRRDFCLGNGICCLHLLLQLCHLLTMQLHDAAHALPRSFLIDRNLTSKLGAGNCLFIIVILLSSMIVNRASRCVDVSGVAVICTTFCAHSVYNFGIWTMYVPGIHRDLCRWCMNRFEWICMPPQKVSVCLPKRSECRFSPYTGAHSMTPICT